jgi:hypothetical protein
MQRCRNQRDSDREGVLEIFPEFPAGLDGIDGYSSHKRAFHRSKLFTPRDSISSSLKISIGPVLFCGFQAYTSVQHRLSIQVRDHDIRLNDRIG